MLLSVVVYNHKLTPGQWLGAAVVFAGISVEAMVKRKGRLCLAYCPLPPTDQRLLVDVHAKRVIQEKEKPKIKSI